MSRCRLGRGCLCTGSILLTASGCRGRRQHEDREEARTQVARSWGGGSGALPASIITAEASGTHGGRKVTGISGEEGRPAGKWAKGTLLARRTLAQNFLCTSPRFFFFFSTCKVKVVYQNPATILRGDSDYWTKKMRHRARSSDLPKATRLAGRGALYVCKVGPTVFHTFTLHPQLLRKMLSHHPVLLMRKPRPKKSGALSGPPWPQSGEAEATC